MDLTTILIILLILLILGIIIYFLTRGGRTTQDTGVSVPGKIIRPKLTAKLKVTEINCEGEFKGLLEVVGEYNLAGGGNTAGVTFGVSAVNKKNVTASIVQKSPYKLDFNTNVVGLNVEGKLEKVCDDGEFAMNLKDIKADKDLTDIVSNTDKVRSPGFLITKPITVNQSSAEDFTITFTLKCCSGSRFLVASNKSNFTNVKAGSLVFKGNGNLNCSNSGAPVENAIQLSGKKIDATKQSTVSFQVEDLSTTDPLPTCDLGTAIIGVG